MPYLPLKLPPGMYRNGTELEASGRWHDGNLVRFYEGTMRPVGGWNGRSETPVLGKARAFLTWRDNVGQVWAAIGTHTGLYAMTASGAVHDITPEGFTPGRESAQFGGGYGAGPYGAGPYGTPRRDSAIVNPAAMWSLDNWGQQLVGVMPSDGVIYQWELNTGQIAQPLDGAPSCRALVATDNRILMALAANGDSRNVAWSDREDNTAWTPTASNYAGDLNLQTSGRIIGGCKVRGGVLIGTDRDVHMAQYLGQPFVYGIERIGSGCGWVSPGCCVTTDTRAFWMSDNGFWEFEQIARPVPCDVGDFVFRTINRGQISKVTGFQNSVFGEVWWLYPGPGSGECDRYVCYNYREGHWTIGALDRTVGVDRGEFAYPMMIASDGEVYDHESGWGWEGATPFIRGGPIQMGQGDRIMKARQYVPDELTSGQAETWFHVRDFPGRPVRTYGPYAIGQPVSTRFAGRQVQVEHRFTSPANARIGIPRLDVVAGGRR